MQRALALSIHAVHVAAVVIAAFTGWEERRVVAPRSRPFGPTPMRLWPGARGDTLAAEVLEQRFPEDAAPQCPMPVWLADMRVSHAMLVVGGDRSVVRSGVPAPCVNPHLRAASQ